MRYNTPIHIETENDVIGGKMWTKTRECITV